MNPTSPVVDQENMARYDDTQICSPFLSESQPNLTGDTNESSEIDLVKPASIPSELHLTSEMLDSPYFPTSLSSVLLYPNSDLTLTGHLSNILNELKINDTGLEAGCKEPRSPDLTSASSSDEVESLNEPTSLPRADLPIPDTLSTLERNLIQPLIGQSRLSGLNQLPSDGSQNRKPEYKEITAIVESYPPDSHEDSFKTLEIIQPLIENRPKSGTVPNSSVQKLLKNRALTVFSFAPLQPAANPLIARKVYLNHITGGALWTFQRPPISLPHSSSHSGIALETDWFSDDDRQVWGTGSYYVPSTSTTADYENVENWPWPLKKQSFAYKIIRKSLDPYQKEQFRFITKKAYVISV
ncbi:unnamed protein product [Echinostoma caproni]|uniref:Uncharacterized protein n=1 Tax=Echinostoma caproni TaxID=27848 RepID=A0A183ARS0_9TREM|nr:unnamed protein product [Echinostoma caproni]